MSYEVLDLTAQVALNQLSVFPASFDRAAALAVVDVESDVAALLDLLLRRSLLEWDTIVERYSLHVLVRAFALTRLVDADAVWMRFARHYVEAAEAANNLYLAGVQRC